jgi:inward rectifier potassium channel
MRKPRQSPDESSLTLALRGDGAMKIKPLGARRWHPSDIYHQLITLTWPQLIALFVATFLCFNFLFAFLYGLDPQGINWGDTKVNAAPYWRAFFFSIDTVATIGYGNMYPVSVLTNILVVVEITLGILFFALVTGIAFARFSRPTARVLFSRVAVVSHVHGKPTLMFRAANQRHNLVFEARATVSILSDEEVDGMTMRRFRDLRLARASTPVFALSWMMMHEIGPDSPIAAWLEQQAAQPDAEIVVLLTGMDERSGQNIHARWAYRAGDIRWNVRLVDIIGILPDGTRTIDYSRFHETVEDDPVEGAQASLD